MSNPVAKKVFDYIIKQSKFNGTAPAQFAVAEYIALNDNEPSFVGATPEKQAEVFKWVKFGVDRFGKFTAADAKELDSTLLKSTYVAYNHTISAADVFTFVSAHAYVTDHPTEITSYPSLYRWMDLIQNSFSGITDWKPKVVIDTNALHATQPQPDAKHAAKLLKKESKQAEKKAAKVAKKEPDQTKPAAPSADPVDPTRLEIRTAVIVRAIKHPDAESLYVETMDVGESGPRTIISGLVNHIPIDEMQNRRCLVLCNLKPVKMRGIFSQGMVLCTSNDDGLIEILNPPEDSVPGDLIAFRGFGNGNGFDAQLNPKKKVWESIQPGLFTDTDRVAGFYDADRTFYPMHVNNKLALAPSIVNGPIR